MALVNQSSMETTVAVGKDCRGVELVAVEQAWGTSTAVAQAATAVEVPGGQSTNESYSHVLEPVNVSSMPRR